MLRELAVSLGLTLALEGIYALLWGLRDRRDWLLLVVMNAVTNPPVVSLYWGVSQSWVFVAVLEAAAVAVEWAACRRWGREIRPAFLFVLCANGFSFFGGLLLSYFI